MQLIIWNDAWLILKMDNISFGKQNLTYVVAYIDRLSNLTGDGDRLYPSLFWK